LLNTVSDGIARNRSENLVTYVGFPTYTNVCGSGVVYRSLIFAG
jgi:hypothetical protein